MKRRAMPWLRIGSIGLGIALMVMLGIRLPWRSGAGLSGAPHGPRGGISTQLVADRPSGDSGADVRSRREEDAESRIRSIFQVGAGEAALVRVSPGWLERLLPPGYEENDDSWLTPLIRDQAASGLADIVRRDGAIDARVDATDREIEWSAGGIKLKAEVRDMGKAGEERYRIHMRIRETGGGGNGMEFIARSQAGSVMLFRPLGPDGDGVLLVLGEDPADVDRGR